MKINRSHFIGTGNALIAAALALCFETAAVSATEIAAAAGRDDSVIGASEDATLTTQIKARLFDVEDLRKSVIRVTVLDAVVTLTGFAASRHAKAVAEESVRSVAGVIKVNDELRVAARNQASADTRDVLAKTEIQMADSWITTKVKSAIMADSSASGFHVNVDTSLGMVSLTGVLADQFAIDRVREVASHVKGVKGVNTAALSVAGP